MVESSQRTIGVMREYKNKWERRCSITPTEVKKLTEQGIKVLVQASTNRCFRDDEFVSAGAIIQEDLSEAATIFAVKEVKIEHLMPEKTYFFFSHTIKAQEYNMELLQALQDKKIRLVDFETIATQEEGKPPERLVAFGQFAGMAGAFTFIRGVGEFLLDKLFQTPFLFIGSTYMYRDWNEMTDALSKVGKEISTGGLPKQLCPMVFGIIGTGRVGKGSVKVLEKLPHEFVKPQDLHKLTGDDNKKIYICEFSSQDMSKHKEGKPYDRKEYHDNPERYDNIFHEYMQYLSFVICTIYWEERFPRAITKKALYELRQKGNCKLQGICDISCDEKGTVEITDLFTSIDQPFTQYSIKDDKHVARIDKVTDWDILFHAVDHLPAEMPKEASLHFGKCLYPFIDAVTKSDCTRPFEEQDDLPVEIKNAIITCNGQLTPKFSYIPKLRQFRMRQMAEEKKAIIKQKLNSIKKPISMVSFVVVGHIIDTDFFKMMLDTLDVSGLNFQVPQLNVGNSDQQFSQAKVVITGDDLSKIDKTMEVIMSLCLKYNIEINHADTQFS